MSCPGPDRLEAFLAGGLDATAEALVRAHARDCFACGERLRGLEPAWLFAALPAPRLEPDEWAEIRAAVAGRIEPGRPAAASWRRWLEGAGAAWRLAPAGLAGAGVLALLLTASGLPGPAVEPVAVLADTSNSVTRAESGFVYLSNPEAAVAQALVAGSSGVEPVMLTLVIDERVADAF